MQAAVPLRVLVTRPRAQAEPMAAALRAAGIDAAALPLIDIAAPSDPGAVQRSWQALPACALVMFVSANAVQHFMRLRPARAAWPAHVLAGSTGPGTSAALRAAGVPPQLLVEPAGEVYDSEALWHELRTRDWTGQHVLVVRGEGGRDWFAEQLGAAGATVQFAAAYERRPPALDAAARALLAAALAQPQRHCWLISSSQAAAHLAHLAPAADWSGATALAPHARIVAALQALGFGRVRLVAANAGAVAAALGAVP
ncbi:MAG TPA: uroporphyrinogen-III synthase [Rubrivivax sp.]|nr:uroporphyrinogen-III synthase [Rubrivivax sp.]